VLSKYWALVLIRLANDAKLRQIGNDASASTATQSSNVQGVRASSTVCSGQTIEEGRNQYTKLCQQHTHPVRESTTTKLFACLVMGA
jgi:hypothetical protein